MTAKLIALSPRAVAERLTSGSAVLIDIREPDEFARRHVKGARSQPLSNFGTGPVPADTGRDIVFTCRTGMRTAGNCDRLAASVAGQAFVLEGGVDGWAAAGLPVEEDRKAPLEIIRQVQITAGLLVLTGIALGFLFNPVFFGLSAFVGAGLTVAGVTGSCAMATVLGLMPWNRTRTA